MALAACSLADLQGADYAFVEKAEDIQSVVAEHLGGIEGVTGMVVKSSCGQFDEIWVTDSGRPFENDTGFTRVL